MMKRSLWILTLALALAIPGPVLHSAQAEDAKPAAPKKAAKAKRKAKAAARPAQKAGTGQKVSPDAAAAATTGAAAVPAIASAQEAATPGAAAGSKEAPAETGAATRAPPDSPPAPASTQSTAPPPSQALPSSAPAQSVAALPEGKPASAANSGLYTVVDGFKVDANTMNGFRTWRSAACDRCHGANQEGMVGPSLIDRLKILTKDEFSKVVLEGRLEKGMPSFGGSEQVVKSIDHLYAYLKGRSDGAITRAKVQPIE